MSSLFSTVLKILSRYPSILEIKTTPSFQQIKPDTTICRRLELPEMKTILDQAQTG